MNTAQVKGFRALAESKVEIVPVSDGFEVRKGGKVQGKTVTYAGARELASLL
jgi:hypothetical protein